MRILIILCVQLHNHYFTVFSKYNFAINTCCLWEYHITEVLTFHVTDWCE